MPPEPTIEQHIRALGTDVRVSCTGADAARKVGQALVYIRQTERHLTRFDPASDLCRLNADPRRVVPASAPLRDGVRAALWAARRSGGLVDPTLLPALECAGYRETFTPGRSHLRVVPTAARPRPAQPSPARAWREIVIDEASGTISRPPGLRLDLGGSGKGYAADLAATVLEGSQRWLVDCGGDLRVGGHRTATEIHVASPLGGPDRPPLAVLTLERGAVATSSTHARRWTGRDGAVAHHLLDPATDKPAWTGLLQVTALAPTVLAAETLAKTALLSGRDAARHVLTEHGGVIVADNGTVEKIGPLPETEPLERSA